MVDFRSSKRFETSKPLINVHAGQPEGKYIFQLTAIDANGNKSIPAKITVAIVRQPRPTGPIRPGPVSPDGPVIIRPVQPRRANESEALIATPDDTKVTKKTTAKKKSEGKKTPSKATSRKTSRTTKRRKKTDTDST